MEFFFFIIFIIIISNVFGATKKKSTKGKAQPWGKAIENHIANLEARDDTQSDQNEHSHETRQTGQDWNELASRVKNISANQARQFGKKQARMRERAREAEINRAQKPAGDSKDADDRNSSRRTDWGERVGPGFISTKTLLVLAGVLVIAVILSQTPANILR